MADQTIHELAEQFQNGNIARTVETILSRSKVYAVATAVELALYLARADEQQGDQRVLLNALQRRVK